MLQVEKSIRKEAWPILDRLIPVILAHVKGCMVEIGMGKYSTRIFAKYSELFERKFYGCDSSYRMIEAIKLAPYIHDRVELFKGNSYQFMEQFDDTPAVVFLDGCHHEGIVRQEVHFFIERMAYDGVIFMHDTMPLEGYYERKLLTKNKEMSTYKIRQELEKMPHVNTFTWPFSAGNCGVTMVIKKDMNRKFYRL